MDLSIRSQLLAINHNFYKQFASSFSATRHQVQPGVRKLAQCMLNTDSILDVGCGNGTLARALIKNGFSGAYLGVDMSEGLLSQAKHLTGDPTEGHFAFKMVDLSGENWLDTVPRQSYDWLTCFAVLHHLPGASYRQQLVMNFVKLTANKSRIAISVWQWQNSPRLRKRVVPWSTLGLNQDDLEAGDVLMDWRAGNAPGLRYVHTFDDRELAHLAEGAGLRVTESFYSDGKQGNLALYQVWEKPN